MILLDYKGFVHFPKDIAVWEIPEITWNKSL